MPDEVVPPTDSELVAAAAFCRGRHLSPDVVLLAAKGRSPQAVMATAAAMVDAIEAIAEGDYSYARARCPHPEYPESFTVVERGRCPACGLAVEPTKLQEAADGT